jgi:hypothetical protein
MIRKNVGQTWRMLLVVCAILLLGTAAYAWRLNFQPVTQYKDGAQITGVQIMYDAWQDGVSLGAVTSSPFQTLDNTYGATHTYTIRTRLSDGRVSDNTVASLRSPLDSRVPKSPGTQGMSLD